MNNSKLKYDAQVDILDIQLSDAHVEESREIEPGVIVDYDENGNVVSVEILDISRRIDRTKVTTAEQAS